ncbi:hypothetical protein Pelo_3258 [Pelomyxa schiedti]|nr:hypothetical protein Pelo_3258 [Pelomyxa schiedti]
MQQVAQSPQIQIIQSPPPQQQSQHQIVHHPHTRKYQSQAQSQYQSQSHGIPSRQKPPSPVSQAATPSSVRTRGRPDYLLPEPDSQSQSNSNSATADCFLCLKAKMVCDHNSPCSRCVSMKVPHMCLSADSINRRLHSQSSAAKLDPSFILGELSVMKREQKKLHEEVLSLRKQNERLEMALSASTSPSLSPASSGTSQPVVSEVSSDGRGTDHERTPLLRMGRAMLVSSPSTPAPAPATQEMLLQDQQAIVIFDLSQNPATVLNATERFCQVLGYGVEEVMGMAWHKLIHRDYVDRTMEILQKNMNNTIDIDQVYVHKDGRLFSANDTHRIFLNPEGKPLLDIVSVRLHTVESRLTGLQALPPAIGPPMIEGSGPHISPVSPNVYNPHSRATRTSSRPPARTLAYPYPSVQPVASQQTYWLDTGQGMPPQLQYITTSNCTIPHQSVNPTSNADQSQDTGQQQYVTYSTQPTRYTEDGCGGYVPCISSSAVLDQCANISNNINTNAISIPHNYSSHRLPLQPPPSPQQQQQPPPQPPPQQQMPPLDQQTAQHLSEMMLHQLQQQQQRQMSNLQIPGQQQQAASPVPPPPLPLTLQLQSPYLTQTQPMPMPMPIPMPMQMQLQQQPMTPNQQHPLLSTSPQQHHQLLQPLPTPTNTSVTTTPTTASMPPCDTHQKNYTDEELFQLIMDSDAFTVHNIP